MEREPRQTLYLPRQLHAQFREIAVRRGHQMSYLLWCALYTAVLKAKKGEPLPAERWDGPVRSSPQLRWRQDTLEYLAWSRLLADAGSSVYAVLVTFIEHYIEAGGDLTLLGMGVACPA